MKKTYYSPAMEVTIWQSLAAICENSVQDEQPGKPGHNPAPRHTL